MAIANTALKVLSIEEAKRQLWIDGDADNTKITTCIGNAVSYVQNFTGRQLVSGSETYMARSGSDSGDPIRFCIVDYSSVDEIKYWGVAEDARDDPGSEIDVEDLGRIEVNNKDSKIAVYPPDGGWPQILAETAFQFKITRGYDFDSARGDSIIQAVIVLTRLFFEDPESYGREKLKMLLRPHLTDAM